MKEKNKVIFVVDDDIINLTICKNIISQNYDVFTIPSGKRTFELLSKVHPDLILLDIAMPEMNGYQVLNILKSDSRYKEIPVIYLTAQNDTDNELKGLSMGAVDYITKPISKPLLLKRIEIQLMIKSQKDELEQYNNQLHEMVEQKTRTIVDLQNAVIETFAELVESRDDLTGTHIVKTVKYFKILVNAVVNKGLFGDDFDKKNMDMLCASSQLHDVGKIKISDTILKKCGKLTEDEFNEMKKHVEYGVEVIKKIESLTYENQFLHDAMIIANTHHEKWNGTGYPNMLSGNDIPLLGRIMAIVDVYDALTSERVYKEKISHEKAIEMIKELSGIHFDPAIVDIFLEEQDKFKSVHGQ